MPALTAGAASASSCSVSIPLSWARRSASSTARSSAETAGKAPPQARWSTTRAAPPPPPRRRPRRGRRRAAPPPPPGRRRAWRSPSSSRRPARRAPFRRRGLARRRRGVRRLRGDQPGAHQPVDERLVEVAALERRGEVEPQLLRHVHLRRPLEVEDPAAGAVGLDQRLQRPQAQSPGEGDRSSIHRRQESKYNRCRWRAKGDNRPRSRLWRNVYRGATSGRSQRSSQARTVPCQSTLLAGLSTQWFSSGKYRNRLGMPRRCRAVKVASPWVSGMR